jgi:hypothetical protein
MLNAAQFSPQKLVEASANYGDFAAVKGLVEGSGTHGAAAAAQPAQHDHSSCHSEAAVLIAQIYYTRRCC